MPILRGSGATKSRRIATLGATVTVNTTAAKTTLWDITVPGGLVVPNAELVIAYAGDRIQNNLVQTTGHQLDIGATANVLNSLTVISEAANAAVRKFKGEIRILFPTTSTERVDIWQPTQNVNDTLADIQAQNSSLVGYGAASEATSADFHVIFSVTHSSSNIAHQTRLHKGTATLFLP